MAGICLLLAVCDALTGRAALKPLGNLIKRTFTLGFSFLMLLLSFLLGLQTTLAAGSDTLALRTVRFAAGSFLPVVADHENCIFALRRAGGTAGGKKRGAGAFGAGVGLRFFSRRDCGGVYHGSVCADDFCALRCSGGLK